MSFISDGWLEHETDGDTLGIICINAERTDDGRSLVFVAERLLWVEARDENVTLEVETFKASEFSTWFEKKVGAGWRVEK